MYICKNTKHDIRVCDSWPETMKIVHASFWTAAFASSFMGFALMVPIWLGRKNEDDNSLELHGAFYQFLCQHGKCETSARVLNSDAVPLEVDAWDCKI